MEKKSYWEFIFILVVYFFGILSYVSGLKTDKQLYIEIIVITIFWIMSSVLIREVYVGISDLKKFSRLFIIEMLMKFIFGIWFAATIASFKLLTEIFKKIAS